MNSLIQVFFDRKRTIFLLLIFFISTGFYSYFSMPKEATPDITIPVIFVTMTHEGISPEDAERMLIKPMEKELRSIEGVKEMTAEALEGFASVTLEFEAGFDKDKALNDVRERVDLAKSELPEDTDEPVVHEISFAEFPVLVVGLSGNVSEHTLVRISRSLRDKIEEIPAVLEVQIQGEREEVVEILVHPEIFENYKLTLENVYPFVSKNNKLVPAGTLDMGVGRVPVKVPGLYETLDDIINTPIKVDGDSVIRFKDIALARKTFKDPLSFAHINGKPSIALNVKKRAGENIIETVTRVRAIVEQERLYWPKGVVVTYQQDMSSRIKTMLKDLQNNLISAVILVMVVVTAALGFRSSMLVGVAIPGSFLMGLGILNTLGLTINNVVLFSLILAVGMLVDGAIIVTEFADRKMSEGLSKSKAYLLASQRMAMPVIASTATTLAAFMPLLFWPGTVGEFMKFLPITLICTLTASLLMALVFIPTLGALWGRKGSGGVGIFKEVVVDGQFKPQKGLVFWYINKLKFVLKYPSRVVLITIAILVMVYALKIVFGKGLEFFPSVEPERIKILVRMRGDLSIYQMHALSLEVEDKIKGIPGIEDIYIRTSVDGGEDGASEDVHGILYIEFLDWRDRPKAKTIIAQIEERLKSVSGYKVEIQKEEAGPPSNGKPIQIQIASRYTDRIDSAVELLLTKIKNIPGVKDVTDSRPPPGIEWELKIDRSEAGLYGANIEAVGNAVQFITNGLKVGDFRPDYSDDEVDIIVRYPNDFRSLTQIQTVRLETSLGSVPIEYFVEQEPKQKVSQIKRSDGRRVVTVSADVREGILPNDIVEQIKYWLIEDKPFDDSIGVVFKGEDEEQEESKQFLFKAFIIALAVIFIILVTQFNSFYQAFLILSAVIFSSIGVLLGLLVMGQPFSIIMNGIGVIALAGIVVNNNIVLIDTYNHFKRDENISIMDAVLRTCEQRLRPVLLTTVTTVLGLLPMVFRVNIDFWPFSPQDSFITYGAPSTQWWSQLATSIVFGLSFATLLTLIVTPSFLVLGERWFKKKKYIINKILNA